MADTVPRTPEEDRPRLTQEELDELGKRKLDGLLYVHGVMGIVLTTPELHALVALAQRTVAAEAEQHAASIARFQELSLIDQERAEQAERTLAAIAEACEKYYGWGGMIEKDTIRRLLQEG